MLRNKVLISLLLISSLFAREAIAVLNLESVGLRETDARALTQRLTSIIINQNKYLVVERTQIDKILKEQKFQRSGCTDSECAVEIGQLLNVDFTIIGTVSKVGRTYNIDSRIINVGSGRAVKSASYTHTGSIDELMKHGIEFIADELLGKNIFFKNINKHRGKIIFTWILGWLIWGWMPPPA